MAKATISESSLIAIADAIRSKTGMDSTYLPSEMASAIMSISGSGGITPTGTINITTNGTHNVTQYANAKVEVPVGETINNQNKNVTPDETIQTITADSGYTGLGTVTVSAIPSNYIVPSGTLSITNNGTQNVTSYASVNVNVPSGGTTINNQNKTVTPSESEQQVTYDNGYTGLGTVTVGAISSTYVGSGITRRDSTDIDTMGALVMIPEGFYNESADFTIPSGTAGTPTAAKGTVSNHSVSITPSVTNTTGYITGDTKNGTAVTVSASELVSGTLSVTSNGTKDVTNYASVNVNISSEAPAIESLSVIPSESEQTFNVSDVDGYKPVTVSAISSTYVGSGITRRSSTDLTVSGATVTAPAGYYSAAVQKSVASGSASAPSSISGTSASVTTGTNTLTLTKTVSVTPVVSVGYVSSGTATNSSVSLTASIPVNPTVTASGAIVTIPTGYYTTQTTKSVASGSATAPSTISGTTATVSTGMNTLTLTKTVSVTPTVSAGYVSSGTAGNSSVSLTASVTTKAAATYHPSTTAQSIAGSTYLTGAQTIAAVTTTNLSASNIVSGVTIKVGDSSDDDCVASITGSVILQNYYTGSSAPASSLGQNGDIYIQQ